MRKYNEINQSALTELILKGMEALIIGFQNIGFRKKITNEIDELKDLVILQGKKIVELEKKIEDIY